MALATRSSHDACVSAYAIISIISWTYSFCCLSLGLGQHERFMTKTALLTQAPETSALVRLSFLWSLAMCCHLEFKLWTANHARQAMPHQTNILKFFAHKPLLTGHVHIKCPTIHCPFFMAPINQISRPLAAGRLTFITAADHNKLHVA